MREGPWGSGGSTSARRKELRGEKQGREGESIRCLALRVLCYLGTMSASRWPQVVALAGAQLPRASCSRSDRSYGGRMCIRLGYWAWLCAFGCALAAAVSLPAVDTLAAVVAQAPPVVLVRDVESAREALNAAENLQKREEFAAAQAWLDRLHEWIEAQATVEPTLRAYLLVLESRQHVQAARPEPARLAALAAVELLDAGGDSIDLARRRRSWPLRCAAATAGAKRWRPPIARRRSTSAPRQTRMRLFGRWHRASGSSAPTASSTPRTQPWPSSNQGCLRTTRTSSCAPARPICAQSATCLRASCRRPCARCRAPSNCCNRCRMPVR